MVANGLTIADSRNPRLRKMLDRLVHVMLTHRPHGSPSGLLDRCVWDAESIIDELENPTPEPLEASHISQAIDSWLERRARILMRRAHSPDREEYAALADGSHAEIPELATVAEDE